MGPNVKALVIRKMSREAIPDGGGFLDGLEFLAKANIAERAREANEWVKEAIAAVKLAPDNPFGDDDEAIAGHILEKIGAKPP